MTKQQQRDALHDLMVRACERKRYCSKRFDLVAFNSPAFFFWRMAWYRAFVAYRDAEDAAMRQYLAL